MSRGELANRGFRIGACAGAALGLSLCAFFALYRIVELHKFVHDGGIDDVDGPAGFLIFFDYVLSFPYAIVLCVAGAVFFALLGGATGILVARVIYRVQRR